MPQRVAIVDFVQTKHGEALAETVQELTFGVVRKLLDRVGIDRSEIGTLISASTDYWQGISCSNSYYYDAAGGSLKSGSKVAEDSAFALIYGVMRILSGHHRTALVVGVTKCSECPSEHTLTNLATDPFFQRPVGLNTVAAEALQARIYLDEYGPTEEQIARVVVKNMSNAEKNPYSHRGGKLSIGEILSSPTVAAPLRRMDVPGTSDGACALLLADEHTARDLTDKPVFVHGLGWSVDHTYIGDRDLLGGALPKAAQMAYERAGVRDPSREIDVAEVCDVTSFHEIMWIEQLGLCEAGTGFRLVEEGATALNGRLPVNPSGGLFGANPFVARGLLRVGEAYLQVRGEAGDHQIPKVNTALAHSVHGLAGQSHSVVILAN
jgi:acetyl-CoA C-acetyltransferase